MIRLGFRLTLNGGREAAVRLIATAAGIALGVSLLLVTVGATNGLKTQSARVAWLYSAPTNIKPGVDESKTDPLWFHSDGDQFGKRAIGRVDIAATGPNSPVPPGIPRLPKAGEFYASPAMAKLLASVPANQLADRYPGKQIGTIGDAGLPGPKSLAIVIGRGAAELSRAENVVKIKSFETSAAAANKGGPTPYDSGGLEFVLITVAVGLLLPVLIFIGATTRLAAARRDQRFAAMRLVGATPRQVALICAIEALMASIIGVIVGFGLFFVAKPALAGIPFTSDQFFNHDLSLDSMSTLYVALGVPLASVFASVVALRRLQISPLGVRRRTTPRPPRWFRVAPLALGIGELATVAIIGPPDSSSGQLHVFAPGFALSVIGLVVAGPWLTTVGARLLARRTDTPSVLLGSRRIADNPQAAFRAISGLVVALFVCTVAITVITTIVKNHNNATMGATGSATVYNQEPPASMPDSFLDTLRASKGVGGVAVVYDADTTNDVQSGGGGSVRQGSFVSCADLSHISVLGRCAPGASVVALDADVGGAVVSRRSPSSVTWPAATISMAQMKQLSHRTIFVATAGPATAERVRTTFATEFPDSANVGTVGELNASSALLFTGYERLANVIIVCSLVIAGCSLAVSVAAGLTERKRPFSLLRLTGVPVQMLRRVIAVESVVPLVVTSAIAIGAGFLASALFAHAQLHQSLRSPGGDYVAVVVIGLVASLAIISSTFPLLERISGPENVRND
jgi:hypothetical protein